MKDSYFPGAQKNVRVDGETRDDTAALPFEFFMAIKEARPPTTSRYK